MKFTALILLTACLQVAARGYSQQISLEEKNASLQKVFKAIEKQTDYVFFFDHKLIQQGRKLTIRTRNLSLQQVLDLCFKDQPFSYSIVKNTIVVKPREADPQTDREQTPVFIPVKGKVLNEQGQPLAGASVSIKGSGTGTQTDAEGNFSIEAPEGSVLVVSYVGFVRKEITVGAANTNVTVTLTAVATSGEDVVVIAYGTVRKKELTGSVSQVKSKDLNAFPSTNVMQAMNGRAAGVRVVQNNGTPGSAVSVRVRGVNSILGGNEPLYVVDGFPYSGNPTFLQNGDIESMEILKDASSIAMYGSRGANGVVMITTRAGRKGDRSTVNLEMGYTVQSVTKKMKLMNPRQYAELYNEQAKNDGLAPYFSQQVIDSLGGVVGTDWQDLVLRSAPIYNTNVSVNGGSDRTKFSLSGGAFLQEGILPNTNFNRYSFRTNLSHDISKAVNVAFNTTLTRITRKLVNSSSGNRGSDVFSAMLMAPPTLSPYMPDGSYRRLTTAYPFISNAIINPLVPLNETSNKVNADRVLGNVAFTFKPIEDLSIRISGGIENSNDRTDEYQNIEPSTSNPGRAYISTSQYTSLLTENIATYSKQFGRHAFALTGGFTYQVSTSKYMNASGTGFLSDVTNTGNLQGAATPGIPQSGYSRDALSSFVSRLNYTFDDRYLFTVSFRRDGSSRYSEGGKWANFPAAAFAWRASNESFLQNSRVISDLKLRTSYGLSGSNAIGAYQTLNQLASSGVVFGDALYTAFSPGTTLPGNLRWEKTNQFDIGVDLGLLKNRIRFTADYYIKRTKDLLNSVQLPASTGYINTLQNVGEVENKGFEFAIEGDVLRKDDWTWTVAANISFNRNKIVKLYNGQDIFGEAIYTGALNDNVNILRQGYAIGRFYGYVETGYTANGNLQYEDRTGDGLITAADKTFIGDPNPDFIYGFNSTARYKNFELSVFIQGSQGNDIFNLNQAATLDLGMGLNQPEEVYLDHWTATKTNAKYPRISRSLNGNMSTRFVEDGSYLRFKNIQLAYNLPAAKWKLSWLRSAQLYVSGQNLITITGYSWYDPEVNAYGSANSIRQGIDYSVYPNNKSVTFGIRCGF